jgi:fatty-acyl-CoA synthase
MAWNLFSHINCLDIRAEEVMLLTTPLPHSSGYHMVAGFLQGAHIVIEPKFDPDRFFELCRKLGVTWTMMVPTMLYRLLDHPAAGSSDHNALATIVYGAAPINRARLEEGLRKFGKVFLQIYGQTECPNLITTLSKDDHTNPDLLASCGRVVPLVELRLRPDESGAGEVEVRSPYLLTEYLRDPVATQEALQDGWLRTGDLARLEDGYLFLVDRAKDMIISGGMNVYSTEVESVLREHPSVREAAVVGIPHPDWGEAVTAVVIVAEGCNLEEIRQFAKARLSAYKAPKSIHFIAEMPLTQYGKIDKRRIRAMMVEELGANQQ